MLTHNEKRALTYLYTISCKFYTIPFIWKDGKMFLKLSQRIKFWNYFSRTLLLISLIFHFMQFVEVIREKNINGSVLRGTALLSYLTLTVFKLNVEMFKSEIIHLLNQLFHINSAWGIINTFPVLLYQTG